MKLNAICIIKNEADIILETIEHALVFCDKIYVFDNGSTDGSYEKLCKKAAEDNRVEIAFHSDETYRNQFRNRVFNKYHHLYSDDDWWYILDADELFNEDPRPWLKKADKKGKNQMRVWQAQFYFTDADLENYMSEDHSLPVAARRKHYRINWREPRFFKNSQTQTWPEHLSGKVPPFCMDLYRPSPICRHYAERTPEQIQARRKIRLSNPYSFLHVKNKSDNDWLKKASDCYVMKNDGRLKFSVKDQTTYYLSEARYWLVWRFKAALKLVLPKPSVA